MRNINSLTSKFQILKKPFNVINSARYYAAYKKKVAEPVKKWEVGINEVRLMGRVVKDPWLATIQGKPTLHLLLEIPNPLYLKNDGGRNETRINCQTVYTQNPTMIKSLQMFVKKGMRVYLCGQLSCLQKVKPSDNPVNVKIIYYFHV